MILKKTVFQSNPPRNKNVIWAVPEGDKIVQRIWNNGNWVPVGGSGDNSSSSTTISRNITYDELQALYDSGVTKVTVEGLGEGVLHTFESGLVNLSIETEDSAILFYGDASGFNLVKYIVDNASPLSGTEVTYQLMEVTNLGTLEPIDLHTLPLLTDKIDYQHGIYHLAFYFPNAIKSNYESIWIGSDLEGNLKKLVVMGTKEEESIG